MSCDLEEHTQHLYFSTETPNRRNLQASAWRKRDGNKRRVGNVLFLLPTSRSEEAASHSSTIPMVIAPSIATVKVNSQNKGLGITRVFLPGPVTSAPRREDRFTIKDTEKQNDVRLGDELGLTAAVDITLKQTF